MRKLYHSLRAVGYLTGIAGLGLFLAGGSENAAIRSYAAMLLVTMAASLAASYAVFAYLAVRSRKHHRASE